MVTAAMVGLDAEAEQPRVVATFTTRDVVTPAQIRESFAQLVRLVRSELGHVEYCAFVEFTTGKGPRSGGRRRPHLHVLFKGLDPVDAPVVAGAAVHVLERVSGAYRHDVQEITTPAGAAMYVASHHLKESQAPPREWGPLRRVRPSRRYWSRPAAELREEATAIVRAKRITHRWWAAWERMLQEGEFVPESAIEEVIEQALAEPPPTVVRVCNPWEDPLGGAA